MAKVSWLASVLAGSLSGSFELCYIFSMFHVHFAFNHVSVSTRLLVLSLVTITLLGVGCSKQKGSTTNTQNGSVPGTAQTAEQPNQAVLCAEVGKFLVQIESQSEVWYVNPNDCKRYGFGIDVSYTKPMLVKLALSASRTEIAQLPISTYNKDSDTDREGLGDAIEDLLSTDKTKVDTDGDTFDDFGEVRNGYNPVGPGTRQVDMARAVAWKGKLILEQGEPQYLWYVNPRDGLTYSLWPVLETSYPAQYVAMRELGKEVSNDELKQWSVGGEAAPYSAESSNNGTSARLIVTVKPEHPVPGGEVTFTISAQGLQPGEKIESIAIYGPEVMEILEHEPFQKTILLPYAGIGEQKYLVLANTSLGITDITIPVSLEPQFPLRKIDLKSTSDYREINRVFPMVYSFHDFTMQTDVSVLGEFESNAVSNLLDLLSTGGLKITVEPKGVVQWANMDKYIQVRPVGAGKATLKVEYQGKLAQMDFTVISANHRPIAISLPLAPKLWSVGKPVTLDGRNSYDIDGDAISYTWTIVNKPEAARNLKLENSTSPVASFIPPVPGSYSFTLLVDDGKSGLPSSKVDGYGKPLLNKDGYVSQDFENASPAIAQGSVDVK